MVKPRLLKNPLCRAFSTEGFLPWGVLLIMVRGNEFPQTIGNSIFLLQSHTCMHFLCKKLFMEKDWDFRFFDSLG